MSLATPLLLTCCGLIFFCHFMLITGQRGSNNIPKYEFDALYDFYNSTDGDNWNMQLEDGNSAWNFSSPTNNPCTESWQGITCELVTGEQQQHIVVMALESSATLNGTIPSTIGNVSFLNSLMLTTSEYLVGTIPNEISKLHHMQLLDLHANSLSGTIPSSIRNMKNLTSLQLSLNNLNGTLPTVLGSLVKLESLQLYYNYLVGTIPPEYGLLSKLQTFSVYDNKLTGTLPNELRSLHSLTSLLIHDNLLTGTLPQSYSELKNLVSLNVNDNQLHGPLLFNIGNLTSLQSVYFGNNQFTGTIPESILQCLELSYITMNNNRLNGTIPHGIGNLQYLRQLQLQSNELIGSIPNTIGNARSMFMLMLSDNYLTHTIPPQIAKLRDLIILAVDNNQLTGTLPLLLTTLTKLSVGYFSYNYLSGTLSSEIAHMSSIQGIILNNNQLTGTVPETLCDMGVLFEICLEENQLTGSLPNQWLQLLKADTLYFYNNQLTGVIPSTIGTMISLNLLNLENNYFTGTVPEPLHLLRRLTVFNLAENILSGSLTKQLSNLRSLELFFVYGNILTGTLSNLFNSTTQTHLLYIDVSNNQFHGSLPAEAFKLGNLQSFAAISNCLSGTLSAGICGAQSLTTLALDGLMSASSCQNRFFPSWTGIRSYDLKQHVSGTVPECLFSMPSLQTLHLSGDGLVGSLSSDLRVGDALTDLSLSHNNLQGSIPSQIYARRWASLDLSYNKFNGQISSDIASFDGSNQSLSLEVNRLSGVIPASLRQAQQISILDGNLFECDARRSELPPHDSFVDIYPCGSNTFNYSMYVWSALICLALGGVVCMVYGMQYSATVQSVRYNVMRWRAVFASTVVPNEIQLLGKFLRAYRRMYLRIVALILIVLLPSYIALSHYYDTYSHEYAWSVSAAYLSGVTATVVLFLLFVAFGFCVFWSSQQEFSNFKVVASVAEMPLKVWTKQQFSVLSALVMLDLVLVTGVNIGYVYIVHSYEPAIVRFTQLCVAVFKVLWNGFIVSKLLQLTNHEAEGEPKKNLRDGTLAVQNIALAVLAVLFNNIAAPFIATGYVSSTCFHDVVTAPPAVDAKYNYASCSLTTLIGDTSVCYSYDVSQVRTTSYDPPFTYSYQCSSTFVTTYSSIYIFMFAVEAFAVPMVLWLLVFFLKRMREQTSRFRVFVARVTEVVLPALLSDSQSHDVSYFSCDAFVVRLLNVFAITCTFGVILPPVAVVCCVAVFSITMHTQLMIGRFATRNSENNISAVIRLSGECSQAAEMFLSSVWIVVPFAALFYALLLFDTLGDQVGWKLALWAPVLTCALPVLMWLMFRHGCAVWVRDSVGYNEPHHSWCGGSGNNSRRCQNRKSTPTDSIEDDRTNIQMVELSTTVNILQKDAESQDAEFHG